MSERFIQQQMYTRGRGGVFHSTDGYDTIAISRGLDKGFIKKHLHPFCLYSSPKKLAASGIKDASLYPEAVTLFQPETGDLVVGQAVFVPADFTGQRSTYFVHNYIIPPGRKEEFVRDSAQLFQIRDFAESYDAALGQVLPEIEAAAHGERNILAEKNSLLSELGISRGQFKQLLFAVMSSIAGKKKVYISLDVPVRVYTNYALRLLELLYLFLPYAHRRRLGVMTFTSEPAGMNYIHVMFFEPGTFNYRDRSLEKQYIFDFAGAGISGVAIDGQTHEYLDYAMDCFVNSERMDEFFLFAEEALLGLPEEQKLELASYYQLTDLYLTIKGQDAFYQKSKAAFVNGLLKFLQVNSDEKPALVELFVELVTEENSADLDYVRAVVSINKIVRRDEPLMFILEMLNHYQNSPLFHQLWKVIEEDRTAHEELVMFMNGHEGDQGLLELYLAERFKPFDRIEAILKELKQLLNSPYLFQVEKFMSVLFGTIEASIKTDRNPFAAVLAVHDFSEEIPGGVEFSDFKRNLLARVKLILLQIIRPDELSAGDIMAFGRIFSKEMNAREMKESKAKENYLLTNALYQLWSNPARAESYNLKSLTKPEREQLREILQRLLYGGVSSDQFPLLMVAYGSDHEGVDYSGALKHLVLIGDGQAIVSYIRSNSSLVGTNLDYRRSLSRYLISNPNSIWKNKAFRKDLLAIRNSSFKNLLKEVEKETAHPVVKFLNRHGIKLAVGVAVTGALISGGLFTYDLVFSKDKPEKPKTEKVAKTVKEAPKDDIPSFIEKFAKMETGGPDQTFVLNLTGSHIQSIVGQAWTATLTNKNGIQFLVNFPDVEKAESMPFEADGSLKNGFTIYGIEYDFDLADQSYEVVLFAKGQLPDEAYLWVYSIDKSNPVKTLEPILELPGGISDLRLDGKRLILQLGDKEIIKEYSTDLTAFTDQDN